MWLVCVVTLLVVLGTVITKEQRKLIGVLWISLGHEALSENIQNVMEQNGDQLSSRYSHSTHSKHHTYRVFRNKHLNTSPSSVPNLHNEKLLSCSKLLTTDYQKSHTVVHMFRYAATFALAQENCMTLVIPESLDLLRYFDLSATPKHNLRPYKFTKVHSNASVIYDVALQPKVSQHHERHIKLYGDLMSWKYFHKTAGLRREFTFKAEYQFNASHHFQKILANQNGHSFTDRSSLVIGINVDKPQRRKGSHSRIVFLQKSIQYFKDRFQDVTFLVHCTDKKWCLNNIKTSRKVIFSSKDPFFAMAVLSHTDHFILETVNSIGWWASWLSGGITVYNKNYPSSNKDAEKANIQADYFLPSWIPL